ncbi:MAG: hypothetical protein HYU68_11050 [Bacteroidetes bacterium]|nr:hypothetical protein [Bacteroidota bacterium]
MKKLLLIVGVVASTLTFGQSNESGTIHVRVGVGFDISGGSAEITMDGPPAATFSGDAAAVGVMYSLKAEYGLADAFSAGIFVKRAGLATVFTYGGFSSDAEILGGFGFGVGGSWYAVNKDKFNFYLAPSVGYTTLSMDYKISDGNGNIKTTTTNYSGLIYGINTGVNVYFGDVAGMFFDLGYAGRMISSTEDEVTTDLSLGGVEFSLGLSLKFGN